MQRLIKLAGSIKELHGSFILNQELAPKPTNWTSGIIKEVNQQLP